MFFQLSVSFRFLIGVLRQFSPITFQVRSVARHLLLLQSVLS